MYTGVETAKVSASALRRLAEKADGLRDQHPYLVVDDHGTVDVAGENDVGERQKVLDLETLYDGDGLRFKPVLGMTVDGKAYPNGTELEVADAVFTSQSAVEKFVFPYYARIRTPAELAQMAKEMFDDKGNVAIIHKPATVYGILKRVPSPFALDGEFKPVSFSGPTR